MAVQFELQDAFLWDHDFERARILAAAARKDFGLAATAVATVDAATTKADIIVTCTTARTPYLDVPHIRKGAFIAAVGADNPEKSEITPALMAWSRVVTDVRDQCLAMGDLHHAVAAHAMTAGDIWAELGDVVSGRKPGRASADDIFIFDSTGTAAQDVAAAAQVYARAVERGIGTSVVLGAA
jgi:ornithine cyclodeaminase/alanine dehydrogenase-like protein (mu-crystallin family)